MSTEQMSLFAGRDRPSGYAALEPVTLQVEQIAELRHKATSPIIAAEFYADAIRDHTKWAMEAMTAGNLEDASRLLLTVVDFAGNAEQSMHSSYEAVAELCRFRERMASSSAGVGTSTPPGSR